MNIRIGGHVDATDGRVGEVSRVVAPHWKLTDIVVRDSKLFGTERLVPVEDVVGASAERVSLRLSHAQFGLMPPYVRTVNYTPSTPDTYLGMAAQHTVALDQADVTEDEMALSGGERVEATDGTVGSVDEVIVDRSTGAVSDIVLREGPLWNKRTVAIPVERVDRVEHNVVYLNLDKQHVGVIARSLYG
jgi:hypothetical protein